MNKLQRIRNVVEGLSDQYELYAAVGALCTIADILEEDEEEGE